MGGDYTRDGLVRPSDPRTEQQDELRRPQGEPEETLEQLHQTPETQKHSVELLLRKRFVMRNALPLTELGDISLPRTLDDLQKKLAKMLEEDLRR